MEKERKKSNNTSEHYTLHCPRFTHVLHATSKSKLMRSTTKNGQNRVFINLQAIIRTLKQVKVTPKSWWRFRCTPSRLQGSGSCGWFLFGFCFRLHSELGSLKQFTYTQHTLNTLTHARAMRDSREKRGPWPRTRLQSTEIDAVKKKKKKKVIKTANILHKHRRLF